MRSEEDRLPSEEKKLRYGHMQRANPVITVMPVFYPKRDISNTLHMEAQM